MKTINTLILFIGSHMLTYRVPNPLNKNSTNIQWNNSILGLSSSNVVTAGERRWNDLETERRVSCPITVDVGGSIKVPLENRGHTL